MGNQNQMNKIEKILLSNSKDELSTVIKAKILNFKFIENSNYINLSLIIHDYQCNQFIINNQGFQEDDKEIVFILRNIKLKMIKNTNYMEIKKYILNKKLSDNYNYQEIYHFNIPKIENNIFEINSNKFIALKLKVKEKDLITHFEYTAFDINNRQILIENLNEVSEQLENNKCYLFNGFTYYENTLHLTNISSIEIIDNNSIIEDIIFPLNINNIINNQIINLKGNIKDLIIEKYCITVEELNSHSEINIILNYDLIKKINPNNLCEFYSFKKIDNKTYKYTELSDIYSDNNTYIKIKVFNSNEQFYNRIKINDNYFIDIKDNINKDIITIKLDSKNQEPIFEQQFIYERIFNNITTSSYKFSLEVNNGRTNNFCTFLGEKGGYTYQAYFQSKEPNVLPKKIKIKIDDNNFQELSDFENFGNILKERITIINAVKQDFINNNYDNKVFKLEEKEFVDYEKHKNLKLYYLVKDKNDGNFVFEQANISVDKKNKETNEIFVFDLGENNFKREYFKLNFKEVYEISTIYEKIIKKEESLLDESEIYEINELFINRHLQKYFEEGIKKFIFVDVKNDYIILKKLLFLYIYYSFKENIVGRLYFISNLKKIIKIIYEADYINKIKVLIYYYFIIEHNYQYIKIIDPFNEKNNNYLHYKPFFEAFNFFFQIIDKQNEKCIFYQSIHQFNGKIKHDLIKDKNIYSGSIIPLLDIKFELIKNINRYFFINFDKNSNSNSTYSLPSQIITIFPYTFMNDDDFKIERRISTITLFLIFHEACGHFKTNMNNNKILLNSPNYSFDKNLNLIFTEFGKNDSGYIFEIILAGNIINVKSMMLNEKAEDLFNIKYYIKNNFDELKSKINEFKPAIIDKNKFCFCKYSEKEKSIKYHSIKETEEIEKNIEKYFSKEFVEKLKEIEKNLDNYNYNTLFPFFRVPKTMTQKTFNDLLKGNIVYEKFMKIDKDVNY